MLKGPVNVKGGPAQQKSNLRELYIDCKIKHIYFKIKTSELCSLHPKLCAWDQVVVGPSGMCY
ncbi:predicted protein [Vibrio cholerae MO10]|uniref:Uncharacterized protein n=1 Tax=Vibrio cholerae (strain MO10) TaxID=345072 RepID=A0A0X1L5K1_VIBCO|nr:predicted protein [Vibrio cholerae MO10]